MSLKQLLWRHAANFLFATGLTPSRNKGKVAILTYHRILSDQDLVTGVVQSGMYVRLGVFEQHMRYLRERFQIVSFVELLDRWAASSWEPGVSYCVVSFDDGWLDNYRNAFPVLKQLQVPATIFLPTDFIGTSRWFWPEQLGYLIRASIGVGPAKQNAFRDELRKVVPDAGGVKRRWNVADSYDDIIESCKALSSDEIDALIQLLCARLEVELPTSRVLLSWNEVREMAEAGVHFGSHSCSHRLLTMLQDEEVVMEAARSFRCLKERGVSPVPVFCYPNGDYDPRVQSLVSRAGYRAATSVVEGLESKMPADLFALKRISLHDDLSSTVPLFALALSGLR